MNKRLSLGFARLRWPTRSRPFSQAELERVCLRNVLASTEERMFFKDLRSRFVLVSEGVLAFAGLERSVAEVIGKTDADFFTEAHAREAYEDERRVIETGEVMPAKLERETFSDRPDVWVSTTKFPLRDRRGRIIGTWGFSRDVSAQVEAEQALAHQALHDGLTGLPNRTLVVDRAEQMLARARREQTPVAALFLDVDGFKSVNDAFGHAAGDRMLKTIAARLLSTVRDADTVGRLSGDEFVVLLDSPKFAASPELVAERILEVLAQPIPVGDSENGQCSISVSIGIAVAEAEHDADAWLRAADLALYQAKEAGKNRYLLFESRMETDAHDRLLLEMDLNHALTRDQFFLVYQPTFDLHKGTVTGVEALLRWRHPERGVVAPDRFIPIAETTGSIVAIGRWVLNHACAQAAEWQRQDRQVGIAVNVSARQLERDEIVDDVRDALMASRLDPALLTLEITETTLMLSPDATARRLRELKGLGVRLAIDDFGTGYSSLAYLRQFPVDALKIDRAFIQGIAASAESATMMHTLVQLGKTLGLETLGEGIEQQAQLQALRHEQCDYGQGFLLARPLELEAIEQFLETAPGISPSDERASASPKPRTRPAGSQVGLSDRDQSANGTSTPPSATIEGAGGAECILVVDDEPAVCALMANVLARVGHRVVTASSAAEAIEVVEQGEVTVVVTDINMPGGMSGLELIDALHAKRPSLPVIPITGAADESSLRGALDRGAAGFIMKPFTSADLREKVDMALHRTLETQVELREQLLAPMMAGALANAIEEPATPANTNTDSAP